MSSHPAIAQHGRELLASTLEKFKSDVAGALRTFDPKTELEDEKREALQKAVNAQVDEDLHKLSVFADAAEFVRRCVNICHDFVRVIMASGMCNTGKMEQGGSEARSNLG